MSVEGLIRPVVSKIKAMPMEVRSVFGYEQVFFSPAELNIGVSLAPSYIDSEVNLRVRGDGADELSLDINAAPLGLHEFSRATRILRGETVGQRSEDVKDLPENDPMFLEYATEHPSRLSLVEGERYRFVAGQKENEVFLDVWEKEAQAPSWRVAVPVSEEKVVIANAKLLIFG